MATSRIISSLTNEESPMNQTYHDNSYDNNNNAALGTEEAKDNIAVGFEESNQTNEGEIELRNGLVDITEQQESMNKRFSKITYTHSEEACMDLFHLLKTSNVPLVMFDRIIRWVKNMKVVFLLMVPPD